MTLGKDLRRGSKTISGSPIDGMESASHPNIIPAPIMVGALKNGNVKGHLIKQESGLKSGRTSYTMYGAMMYNPTVITLGPKGTIMSTVKASELKSGSYGSSKYNPTVTIIKPSEASKNYIPVSSSYKPLTSHGLFSSNAVSHGSTHDSSSSSESGTSSYSSPSSESGTSSFGSSSSSSSGADNYGSLSSESGANGYGSSVSGSSSNSYGSSISGSGTNGYGTSISGSGTNGYGSSISGSGTNNYGSSISSGDCFKKYALNLLDSFCKWYFNFLSIMNASY